MGIELTFIVDYGTGFVDGALRNTARPHGASVTQIHRLFTSAKCAAQLQPARVLLLLVVALLLHHCIQ